MAIGDEQAEVFEFGAVFVIAQDAVVPAFNIEVASIAGADQFFNERGPIGIAYADEAMLDRARMVDAVAIDDVAIDFGVFGVDVKNFSAEFADVLHGVDEHAE